MNAALDAVGWSGRVCAIAELPMQGASMVCGIEDRRIAIFNVAGALYAVDDLCTHAQSSLSGEGRVCGLLVECALHRAQFSLETGRAMSGPTRKPLRSYELICEEGNVIATEVARRISLAADRK